LTLIELLVVITVLVILLGIGGLVVARQVGVAKDRASEADMRTLGMTAYQGFIQSMTRADVEDFVESQVKGERTIRWTSGAAVEVDPEARFTTVVAELAPADSASEFFAARLVRPGRCTVVSATDTGGYVFARTVDVANDSLCRAGLGQALPLVASDFNSRVGNPYNGSLSGPPEWDGDTLLMPRGGMLLSKTDGPALTNGSLSANVTVGEGSNGAGIVFRANSVGTTPGALSGYVLQIDPGFPIGGRPGVLIRPWTNGSEGAPLMRVQVPEGVDVRSANNLRIQLDGDNYTAYVNNIRVGSGTLPGTPTGTQYGARTWSNVPDSPNRIGDFTLEPSS
jgi:hypothetical protein